jgi:hypothetical protein
MPHSGAGAAVNCLHDRAQTVVLHEPVVMAGIDQPFDDMITIELAACDQLGQREGGAVELMVAPTRSRAGKCSTFIVKRERLPKPLHKRLLREAKRRNVSLNTQIVDELSHYDLEAGLWTSMAQEAIKNGRTLNAEIVVRLKGSLVAESLTNLYEKHAETAAKKAATEAVDVLIKRLRVEVKRDQVNEGSLLGNVGQRTIADALFGPTPSEPAADTEPRNAAGEIQSDQD